MKKEELLKDLYKLKRTTFKNPLSSFLDYETVSLTDVIALVEGLNEPEKAVIPRFVAEAFEKVKGSNVYAESILKDMYNSSDEVAIWLVAPSNEKLLLRAWLDGYEVEKEKLYYIPLGILRLGDTPIYLQKTLDGLDVDWSPPEHMYRYKANYHFTEKEIKNYDERFWPFAVEVEE